MGYEYACFISYKRPPAWTLRAGPAGEPARHALSDTAEEFQTRLDYFLTLAKPSFRDVQLEPATKYEASLAKKLCHSLCMVALVVPQYFESAWCVAEWNAMEVFERKRLNQRGKSLIIPVLVGGDPTVLNPKLGGRSSHDLRGVGMPAQHFKNPRILKEVHRIADAINSMEGLMRTDPTTECDQFSLEIGLDSVLPEYPEPSPFAR
jgi:TIR domain